MNIRAIIFLTIGITLTACGSEYDAAPSERHKNQASLKVTDTETSKVVASFGDQEVLLSEIDAKLGLAIFDLEWRKYEMRKNMLSQVLSGMPRDESQQRDVTVFLEPPSPPRIELPSDKRPMIGLSDAPVKLAVFCSYQSSHCGRLYPVLKELKLHYGRNLSLRFFDYPQRFHRHGFIAANAVHCAQEQGVMKAFQSALYLDQQSFSTDRFVVIAEQLGMDLVAFQQCAESARYASNIEADLALGKKIGLGNVPVVFINGLYAKGPKTAPAYQYYIDKELNRLGVARNNLKNNDVAESTLPYELIATTVSSVANQSTAQLALSKGKPARLYLAGDLIADDVRLARIEDRRIIVENRSRMEFIRLKGSEGYQPNDLATMEVGPTVDASGLDEKNSATHPQQERQFRELPAQGEMVLDKNWVDEQLMDKAQLSNKFHLAEHVVEGVHLLKLNNIQDERFFNTLGLKNGDVLLRVNDQWVHEQKNPLWDALEAQAAISIVLMRQGYPVRYDYQIQ